MVWMSLSAFVQWSCRCTKWNDLSLFPLSSLLNAEGGGGGKWVVRMLESHRKSGMMWGVTREGGMREAQQWEAP